MPHSPTTIAFYLPQFHPVPENDGWYGPGFTEWHNVVQSAPLFPGHNQPHLPKDFGFYDLRVPEVRLEQARVAKAHGIDAFCYYHYWFEGQRPLHRPLDDVLDHSTPDMPFCLAWANENWSRHWDASAHEVLLRQRYSAEDDEEHGRFLLRAMSHPLYLRVDGRPVLFIYRIQSLPDPKRTMARWREIWREGGIDDVHIVKFETHGDFSDPAGFGVDASAQFVPHGTADVVTPIHPAESDPGDLVLDYQDVAEHYLSAKRPEWTSHECVVPDWDNSPRRGKGRSLILHGSTPEKYEEWLSAVYHRTPDNGLVLVNAWNEWAEGAHLEPDLRNGDAYLKATARAIGAPADRAPDELTTPLAVVPFAVRDRFGDLYLDALATQTRLQRRLSRLEATLDRQIDFVRTELDAELAEVRQEAAVLAQENQRLHARIADLAAEAEAAASVTLVRRPRPVRVA
jgi:lipopolysaccharide biosynthesis protein